MESMLQQWLDALGSPEAKVFDGQTELLTTYQCQEYIVKVYLQQNDTDTFQRVMVAYPLNATPGTPAVVVPFYYPEAMLGFIPETGEQLPKYTGIEMMHHLVRRGYIVACAEAYHLTVCDSIRDREDFARWQDASHVLLRKYPQWSGIGKLVHDTRLLIDLLELDPLVDSNRIGIAGHSLGGKMAFYTGCLDPRIKVILASDFGIGWNQTNWRDPWYWGDKVDELIQKGMDHSQLLSIAAPKPFCLLAGESDNEHSWEIMQKAEGYPQDEGRLKIIHHASGHRPPWAALTEGYDFLSKWL